MTSNRKPSSRNGTVCYLEIPAKNPERSARFYHEVFGWTLRRHREDGLISFDDGAGERRVSGMWVTDRPPIDQPGIIISIWVDDAAETVKKIVEHGGEIVRPLGFNPHERVAWFRDPGGNVLGVYQEPL